MLGGAFRHALQVGKRARTETAISRGSTSLSYAAVELAATAVGGLAGKQALVARRGGSGRDARPGLSPMCRGAGRCSSANRTARRADRSWPSRSAGRRWPWDEVAAALADADVVACCTAAEAAVLSLSRCSRQAMAARAERPGPARRPGRAPQRRPRGGRRCPASPCSTWTTSAPSWPARLGERRAEVPAVERIVAEEVDRYNTSLAARSVAPLVTAVHDRAEEVRRAEMARLEAGLRQLSPDERAALDLITRRIVAKLLHEPTVNLKAAAGTARGERAGRRLPGPFRPRSPSCLRLATRGSQLALWQARPRGRAAAQRRTPAWRSSWCTVTTTGDRRVDVPVWEMGGQGVFVREVQAAVLDGRADAAVHSAKDLQPVDGPGPLPGGRARTGRPPRRPGRARLADLAPGRPWCHREPAPPGPAGRRAARTCSSRACGATSAPGWPGSRPGGAIVVAMAALDRLGLAPEPMEVLGTDVMLPQVAQGALAVECRADDDGHP